MFNLPQLSGLEYLLISVIGAFMLHWFKTSFTGSKETLASLATRVTSVESALTAKLASVEASHYALALKYEGNYNRHDEALDTLEGNVKNLTDAVNRLCFQMAKFSP